MKFNTLKNKYNNLIIFLLFISFMGPYYPGTRIRLDQLLGWIIIMFLFMQLFAKRVLEFSSKEEKNIVLMSYLICIFTGLRLFINPLYLETSFQIANQYSYFAAGCAIFFIFRDRFNKSKSFVIGTLLSISVIVNLFAVLQYIDPQNWLVNAGFTHYGGKIDQEYGAIMQDYGDYSTMAAVSVIADQRAVSIFSGMQGLAVFNLFIIAIAIGTFNDSLFKRQNRWIRMAILILALFGGVLSGSKTFILGFIVMLIFIVLYGNLSKNQKAQGFFILIIFFVIFNFIASQHRITGDIWNLIFEGRWLDPFVSRFGTSTESGYLSDVMAITFEPFTLLLGLGSEAGLYKYSDFEYRQVVIVGGLPLFILYFSFLVYLIKLNWQNKKLSPYGLPLFALGIAFLCAGIGMDVHKQARVIPLWIIMNLLLGIPRSGFNQDISRSKN